MITTKKVLLAFVIGVLFIPVVALAAIPALKGDWAGNYFPPGIKNPHDAKMYLDVKSINGEEFTGELRLQAPPRYTQPYFNRNLPASGTVSEENGKMVVKGSAPVDGGVLRFAGVWDGARSIEGTLTFPKGTEMPFTLMK